MTTLLVIGIAVTVVGLLFAAALAWNTPHRENRFAASGDPGIVPWVDGGGGSGDCDPGSAADAGCGDGGGGAGGE